MAPRQLRCFAKSDKNKETPNLQYHIQPLSTEKLGDPLHPFEAFTASVCNLRPESRGHVHIKTEDSREPPKIQPDYLSDPADRKVAADAIKLTRKIVSSPAMKKFEPEEFKPGIEFASDDDLARALAASLQDTRRPAPTDISSVLAAAGLSRHLPLFRREEIESVEDLRYLSVDDFVAIGLERNEAQDLSRMCATVAV